MSETNRDDEGRKPLPEPVGEDGIVRQEERAKESEQHKDGGLAETGGGDPDKRKIA